MAGWRGRTLFFESGLRNGCLIWRSRRGLPTFSDIQINGRITPSKHSKSSRLVCNNLHRKISERRLHSVPLDGSNGSGLKTTRPSRSSYTDDHEPFHLGVHSSSSQKTNPIGKVAVTKIRPNSHPPELSKSQVRLGDGSMELVDQLLLRTSEMMDPHAANVVAYSGGVDSSLVSALVHRAFSDYWKVLRPCSTAGCHGTNEPGSVRAVLGISAAVSHSQISMARQVAGTIGIPLAEVKTSEGSDDNYRQNDGYACYVCKSHLYSALESVANEFLGQQHRCLKGNQRQINSVILYNGTNADDTRDHTRLGLVAASNFQIRSPLDQTTKDQVRQAAKYLGLPNWNAAASPCLRSRLAMGVMATEGHLRAVEMAEEFVRKVLGLDDTVNARVRMLAGGKAMVELDNSILGCEGGTKEKNVADALRQHGFEDRVQLWGFNSFGGVRRFRTGSVAAMPSGDNKPFVPTPTAL